MQLRKHRTFPFTATFTIQNSESSNEIESSKRVNVSALCKIC